MSQLILLLLLLGFIPAFAKTISPRKKKQMPTGVPSLIPEEKSLLKEKFILPESKGFLFPHETSMLGQNDTDVSFISPEETRTSTTMKPTEKMATSDRKIRPGLQKAKWKFWPPLMPSSIFHDIFWNVLPSFNTIRKKTIESFTKSSIPSPVVRRTMYISEKFQHAMNESDASLAEHKVKANGSSAALNAAQNVASDKNRKVSPGKNESAKWRHFPLRRIGHYFRSTHVNAFPFFDQLQKKKLGNSSVKRLPPSFPMKKMSIEPGKRDLEKNLSDANPVKHYANPHLNSNELYLPENIIAGSEKGRNHPEQKGAKEPVNHTLEYYQMLLLLFRSAAILKTLLLASLILAVLLFCSIVLSFFVLAKGYYWRNRLKIKPAKFKRVRLNIANTAT